MLQYSGPAARRAASTQPVILDSARDMQHAQTGGQGVCRRELALDNRQSVT